MSSRNDEYENFLNAWKELVNITNLINSSGNESESIEVTQELARLLKVITYLDESIKSIDSELVPLTFWKECANYCITYKSNIETAITTPTEASVQAANTHIDYLLGALSPYIQDSLSKLKALKPAFNTHLKYISSQLEAYNKKNDTLVEELENNKIRSSEIYDELSVFKEDISKLHTDFLVGTDENSSLQEKLRSLENSIDEQHSKINEFYESLLIDEGSIQSKIEEAQELITTASTEAQEIRDDFSEKLSELDEFHKKIFGESNEDGNIENGLKFEINKRKEELESFKNTQTSQYQALKTRIEGLLPGATSAGLASAYHDLSVSFIKPIRIYTGLFFVSIAILLGLALYFTSQNTILTDVPSDATNITIMKDIGIFLLQRLPIILPVIWFAVFSSKRRSEAERLRQEYAHKEALAKSYQSFKKQIEELDDEKQEPLLEKLLGAAIDTIAANASNTLDKKHGDKTPLNEIIDKVLDRSASLKDE